MRVGNDPDLQQFDQWLGSIGDGTLETSVEPDWADIAYSEISVTTINDDTVADVETSLDKFIQNVFPNLKTHMDSPNWPSWISERAILAPKNAEVDKINLRIIDEIPGDGSTLFSSDATVDQNQQTVYPVEILNCQTPAGLPPHQLTLKVNMNDAFLFYLTSYRLQTLFQPGMVLILLRNLNPKNGLCNGTRMILEQATKVLLHCKLVSGKHYKIRTSYNILST